MSTLASSLSLSTLDLTAAGRQLGKREFANAQQDFARVLTRATEEAKTPEEQARAVAEQFVSIAMVQPLLAQLRDNNRAAPPFAPSQGEKQFQTLFDAQIAQRITHAKRFPLVDAVAQRLIDRLPSKTAGAPDAAADQSAPRP